MEALPWLLQFTKDVNILVVVLVWDVDVAVGRLGWSLERLPF